MATVVTKTGKQSISGRMTGATTGASAEPKNLAWGTFTYGSTNASANDVAMFVEGAENRVAGTSSQVSTAANSNDTYQVTGTITATGTRGITEAGLFDSTTKPGTDAVQAASGVIASSGGTTVIVVTGATFAVNEYIQIRGEVMKITGIASNTLTVTRAQNGTSALTTIAISDTVTIGNIPTQPSNTVTGGYNFTHADFSVVNLSSGDSISFTWGVQFT